MTIKVPGLTNDRASSELAMAFIIAAINDRGCNPKMTSEEHGARVLSALLIAYASMAAITDEPDDLIDEAVTFLGAKQMRLRMAKMRNFYQKEHPNG